MSPAEHHKFTRFAPFVVMGLVALVGGVFFTVLNSQQSQDNRSRASITTGTYVGTLIGDGKIIGGSVTEDVIGSNNTVGGSVGGCIKGNNNIVGGIVAGTVSGTGNVIAGGIGNGPCLSSQSTTTLVKAINFKGPDINVDGIPFQSDANAGVTYSTAKLYFDANSVPLIPTVSTNKAIMIRSSVWNPGGIKANVPVSNGSYQVYIYNWEDTNAQTFAVSLEGQSIGSFNSGVKGAWKKLGPFSVNVADNSLNLTQTGGDFNLSGMEIYKTTTTTPPTSTPVPVTPTPTKPAPTATPVPGVAKVSVSPTSVGANGTLTVTWSGVNNPTVKDWIGLMSSNSNLDANPWVYTSSCSQAAAGTTAKSSGTCSLKAPSASGSYTVKLLANDTFVQLASGNTISVVSSQPTPTPSGDTQAPTAPINLRSTSITSAAVGLAWNASTDAVGVTQYNISRGNEAGTNFDYTDSVNGSTLTFTDTSVQAGIIYKYRVRAKDAAGNLSDFSNVITVGVPTAPLPTPRPTIVVDPFPTATPQPTSTPAPTMTPAPGSTSVNLNLALHGIGKGGDSANPTGTGNTTPIHPQRIVAVEVFDSSNASVKSVSGTVTYDTASGHFKGLVSLGTGITNGSYTIRVKTNQLLRTVVPGIQNLISGNTFDAPLTAMVTGDINNDNQLNILDYNVLMGCYSDLSPAVNCPAGDELRADITDDGDVNQFDYNLFLRELINRGGQ